MPYLYLYICLLIFYTLGTLVKNFTEVDYGGWITLKGAPFIIKYDAELSKGNKLKAHKDNAVSAHYVLDE